MTNAFFCQACAQLAFARAMGWDDWDFAEEAGEGMVRGYHVQWSPEPCAGMVVHDDGDDEAR